MVRAATTEEETGVGKILARLGPLTTPAVIDLVRKAYLFASEAHQGQVRVSGEPFIIHPAGVAEILAELDLDGITIASALLHDVVEDTAIGIDTLRTEFGSEIAGMVDGVTKLSRIEYRSKEEHQAENLRKLFVAMAEDIRVLLIKLADRLHNMRTLDSLPAEKQREISLETMEIYAPLANRLGIFRLRWELEDLAFAHLEPETYQRIVRKVAKKRSDREAFIKRCQERIAGALGQVWIKADIQGRPKHLYSIYKKMHDQNRDFEEIYDLTAVRVLTESVKDCYGALGVIHSLWKPIPGRFKDFIAVPKPNMYQSLHTTVITEEGERLEIQIRTREMHRTAEYGIAAHWRYKESLTVKDDPGERMSWLRQVLEWQQDLRDASEFVENLKIDLYTDEVFVFTPKGDVIDLPAESVPVDFAYRIHTDVGHRCTGARINGKIVPLGYKLKNGDIVEIITSKHGSPSRDWLQVVKTPQARNKIRGWLKRQRREENVARGRDLLEREIRKTGREPEPVLAAEGLAEVGQRLNYVDPEDFLAAIGYGDVSASQAAGRLLNRWLATRPESEADKAAADQAAVEKINVHKATARQRGPSSGEAIVVKGVDGLLSRLAKCCSPVPGDEIVGYTTRGRGISVHRKDCPNLVAYAQEKDRLLEVVWNFPEGSTFPVQLQVTGLDRSGLVRDIVEIVAEHKVNMSSVNGRALPDRTGVVDLTLQIRDLAHLDHIIQQIKKIRDIYHVRRAGSDAEPQRRGTGKGKGQGRR